MRKDVFSLLIWIQTVQVLEILITLLSGSSVEVSEGDELKYTWPGDHLNELKFPAYTPDQRLCPVLLNTKT